MNTRTMFKRRVIELIHNLPYWLANKKEIMQGCLVRFTNEQATHKITTIIIDNAARLDDGITAFRMNKHHLRIYDKSIFTRNDISEFEVWDKDGVIEADDVEILGLPITIGRVMQAIKNKSMINPGILCTFGIAVDGDFYDCVLDGTRLRDGKYLPKWELLKKDGCEATDDNQTDETIESLYKLIN